jgi:hypothetical protein
MHFVSSIVATIIKKLRLYGMDSGNVNAGSSEIGRAFSWMIPSTEGFIKLIVDLSITLLTVIGRVEAIQIIDLTKFADHRDGGNGRMNHPVYEIRAAPVKEDLGGSRFVESKRGKLFRYLDLPLEQSDAASPAGALITSVL